MISTLLALTVFSTQCTVCKFDHSTSRVLTHKQVERKIDLASEALKLKLSSADKMALKSIIYRESKFVPTARNKKSSAYGLGQFLESTWKSTGIKKTSCPICQIQAMLIYVKHRYKTPTKALQHSKRRGWY